MKVIVVDRTRITSNVICRQLTWNMQEKKFLPDLRLIPLGRCNMVLGIQWLAKLGIILWDFNNLRIELIVDGRKFVLRNATTSLTKLVSIDQIQKDLGHLSQAFTVQILFIQGNEKNIVEKEKQGNC